MIRVSFKPPQYGKMSESPCYKVSSLAELNLMWFHFSYVGLRIVFTSLSCNVDLPIRKEVKWHLRNLRLSRRRTCCSEGGKNSAMQPSSSDSEEVDDTISWPNVDWVGLIELAGLPRSPDSAPSVEESESKELFKTRFLCRWRRASHEIRDEYKLGRLNRIIPSPPSHRLDSVICEPQRVWHFAGLLQARLNNKQRSIFGEETGALINCRLLHETLILTPFPALLHWTIEWTCTIPRNPLQIKGCRLPPWASHVTMQTPSLLQRPQSSQRYTATARDDLMLTSKR